MTSEDSRQTSRFRRVASGAVLLAIFGGGVVWMGASTIERFRHDGTFMWDKFFPLVFFLAVMMSVLFLRGVFIAKPDPSDEGVRTKLFKYEDQTLITCLIGAAIGPFLIQPLVDYAIMPTIGYEYCEAMTIRGPTFGFPTYAYVPDPTLCVALGTNR